MMNIILKMMSIISMITILFMACDDKEMDGTSNMDPQKMVSFAQDTFYLPEESFNAIIPIVVPKYVNGAVQLILECENMTAKRDTHFYIDILEAKIIIGRSVVDFPIEIYDDTVTNVNRCFKLSLSEVSGAAYAGLERQECIIVIVNDDFPAQATAVFSQQEMEVYENDGEIKLPFKIMGAGDTLKGDASITFAYDETGGTANDKKHFKFKNEGKVQLKKGDSGGFVVLEIINNTEQEEDVWADIFMTESEGVFLSEEMSTCRLTIREDDIARTIGFVVVKDTALENSGQMEVLVLIDGPKFKEPTITGELYFLGHDSLSANRGLRILGDPKFKVRGDTTLTFLIEIDDNTDFGYWGDSLGIDGITGGATLRDDARELHITIADDERIVYFEVEELSDNENAHKSGGDMDIKIMLKGGKALEDTDISLKILENTTLEGQYKFIQNGPNTGPNIVTISKGKSEGVAKVKFYENPSKLDTYFLLGLESDKVSTAVEEGASCKINILNIDPNVQFSTPKEMIVLEGAKMSIGGINLPGDLSVKIEVVSSPWLTVTGQMPVYYLNLDKLTADINLNIENTDGKSGEVTVKIIEILDNDDALIEDIINPDFYETTIYVAGNTPIDLPAERIEGSAWEVLSYTTNEPNEGSLKGLTDNDPGTFWHTKWSAGGEGAANPPPPYIIIMDMKKEVFPQSIELLARSEANAGQGDSPGANIYFGDTPEGPWRLIFENDNRETKAYKVEGLAKPDIARYVKFEVPFAGGRGNVVNYGEFKIFGNLIEQ